MPQPFPDPSFNDTTGLVDHVNTLTNGWATVLVSIAIPIVIFAIMISKDYKKSHCFLVSFFLGFFLSTYWWGAGLLDGRIVVALLLFTIASGIYTIFDSD